MKNDVPKEDGAEVAVQLHGKLEVFLQSLVAKSGRSLQGEIVRLIGEAMDAAEIPPARTNTPFVCSEELMVEKAECQDCRERILHNAKVWAERHVQSTGHNVHVTLHYDMRAEDWFSRIAPERRAEIKALQKPGVGIALTQALLTRKKH